MHRTRGLSGPFFQNVGGGLLVKGVGNSIWRSAQPYAGLYDYAECGSAGLIISGPFTTKQTLADWQIYSSVTTSHTLFGAT